MFKDNNKDTRTTSMTSMFNFEDTSCFFSTVSIVNFEQVNVCCDIL